MEKNLDIRVCCEEMRTTLYRQLDGIGNIKATTRTIFQAASLVIALIGALQLFTGKVVPEYQLASQIIIFIVFGLYIGLIFLCLSALFPITSFGPIEPKWEVLHEHFIVKSEREIYEMQLSAYLNAINLNKKNVHEVKSKTIWAGRILGAIVLILLLLSLMPKV
jgi:hypothetical protein